MLAASSSGCWEARRSPRMGAGMSGLARRAPAAAAGCRPVCLCAAPRRARGGGLCGSGSGSGSGLLGGATAGRSSCPPTLAAAGASDGAACKPPRRAHWAAVPPQGGPSWQRCTAPFSSAATALAASSASGARVEQQGRQAESKAAALSSKQLAKVTQYLGALSEEQQAAVRTSKQHVRVIAGPGSGKTRVVTARVAWLISQGVDPSSILVITFTNKAAGELVERLEALLGQRDVLRLRPRTFHSLCHELLREHYHEPEFLVNSEDDVMDVLLSVLVEASGRADAKVGVKEAGLWRKAISRMKNFVTTTHRLSGAEVVAQVKARGCQLVRGTDESRASFEARAAAMYDAYSRAMDHDHMKDFDDLLHHCLAMAATRPEVLESVHARWSHVLVDESQDTNLVQFEIVRRITGPRASLFMVGDPDQAIYGFRGANSTLLSEEFVRHYGPSAGTCFLSDNYRSRQPIVQVADLIRHSSRGANGAHMAPAAVSKRGLDGSGCDDVPVSLLEAEDLEAEADAVVSYLKAWRALGKHWRDMAVLVRSRYQIRPIHSEAMQAGIPCHVHASADFWERVEVRVALALLRCVVRPGTAGDAVRQRLVRASTTVKVPLMAGLGAAGIEALQSHLPPKLSNYMRLGTFLFAGCSGPLDAEGAAAVLQEWEAAKQQARAAAKQGTAPHEVQLAALEALAPPWQLPEGMKWNKPQRAAVSRLRGMARLGGAAAELQTPEEVLQLLLDVSGVAAYLEEQGGAQDADVARAARERAHNLDTLRRIARNQATYAAAAGSAEEGEEGAEQEQERPPSPARGLEALKDFYTYCSLMGEAQAEDAAEEDKVQLMTIHASKGKEWDCVAVPGVADGMLPSLREDEVDPAAALRQDRNTLFVAATRARDHLLVSWAARGGFSGGLPMQQGPSRFLQPVLARPPPGVVVVEDQWSSTGPGVGRTSSHGGEAGRLASSARRASKSSGGAPADLRQVVRSKRRGGTSKPPQSCR